MNLKWSIILLAAAAAVALVMLAGCSEIRVDPKIPAVATPTLEQQVEKLTKEKADSDQKAAAAIKTSADAKAAANEARAEAAAARELAKAKDAEATRLDKAAKDLGRAEVAARIAIASWWTFAAGCLGLIAGIFLCVRFPASKTSWSILVSSFGVAVFGLVGVWLAPQWFLVAWIGGCVLVAGVISGAVYLAHKHDHHARSLQGKVDELEQRAADLAARLVK